MTPSQVYEVERPAGDEASVHPLPPPPPWRRLRRLLRTYPLVDPLGQAVISLALSIALGAIGTWLLEGSRTAGIVLLVLSGGLALFYLALVARAVKRDKAIRYWRDRRNLRLSITQEKAHHAFMAAMLEQIHYLDGESRHDDRLTDAMLAGLVSRLYRALATSHDDLAVVFALAAAGHYRILHSTLSRGSRWRALKPGKCCEIKGPLEDTLSELAEHHHFAEALTDLGILCVIALADTPLDDSDRVLIDRVPLCLELITARRPLQSRRRALTPLD